ncbi:uncharacterized protein UBRO_20977 [Ustilago bromivora]|uniref:Uncharacterized protein n=1 Tax=Ustilago bromivora TaxID=307758 RepID=A0A1K0HMJ4_9BASI|nr:uncharacterized protein UBRO_20977 [Ustilago bromivora]
MAESSLLPRTSPSRWKLLVVLSETSIIPMEGTGCSVSHLMRVDTDAPLLQVLAFFTELKPAPPHTPPRLIPFVFDSGTSCVMVNSAHHRRGWRDADGGKLPIPKVGGTISLLSFNPIMRHCEQMVYNECILVPGLVTNLIGTRTVTQAKGKVTFKDELVTVQDHHSHAIGVPTSSDGYPATGMILWNDNMPEPKVSLAFVATKQGKCQQSHA